MAPSRNIHGKGMGGAAPPGGAGDTLSSRKSPATRFLERSVLAIFLAATICLAAPGHAPGVSPDEARKKYEGAQKEIKSREARVEQVKKAEQVTLDVLHRLSRELAAVSADLRRARAGLLKTRKDVSRVRADVALLREKIGKRKSMMRRKLQAMQRHGVRGDALLLLAASEDVAQLMRMMRYLESLAAFEAETIRGYRKDLSALRAREAELRRLESRLAADERAVRAREAALRAKKTEKERLLASLRHEKASYERMIRDLRKISAGMMKIIKESEKSLEYAGSGFRSLRGRMPWPVTGFVAIPYGAQKDPRFNTPVFRNGIYIEADEETVAKSVSGGKVVYADWFKGYGQLVIVNHGQGYHTLYANLSEIFLKRGDIIGKEDAIGRVGSSGLVERPSLYFEIRYKGKPLNPSQWLKGR